MLLQPRLPLLEFTERSTSEFLKPEFLDELVLTVAACLQTNIARADDLAGPNVESARLKAVSACLQVVQTAADRMRHETFTKIPGTASPNRLMTAVNTFALAGLLKNDSFALKACRWALQYLLPPDVSAPLMEALVTSKTPASPSTISRMRGRINVALMLSFRATLTAMMQEPGVYLYPMVDASPQGSSACYKVRGTGQSPTHLNPLPQKPKLQSWAERGCVLETRTM